jgi:cytochrome c553
MRVRADAFLKYASSRDSLRTRVLFGSAMITFEGKVKERNVKKTIWIVAIAIIALLAPGAATPQQDPPKDLSWAYPVPDKNLPPETDVDAPRHVPGSTKTYTKKQIDDLLNPPDWFPDEHASPPAAVAHAKPGAMGCGACHLMSGLGHPESADLTRQSAAYLERQLADFKNGSRKDQGRMITISKALSDDDAKQVSEWFASLKGGPWIKVVEAQTVPQTWVDNGRMRLPVAGGATEPIGNRIIELPLDPDRVLSRDPHSGFTAYVPVGSVAKGENLATTGGGKTLQCSTCHGDNLAGMGDAPRIAGLHPIYIVRELYNFQNGTRGGASAALMKAVVADLNDDDIVSLAAYIASKNP